MKYELVTIENSPNKEVLTKPSKPVEFPLNKEMQDLVAHMKEEVIKLGGVGLAAPQIGQDVQIMVVYISDDAMGLRKDAVESMGPTVFINPDYKPIDGSQMVDDWEGCFSVEETTGKVPRHSKISYTAFNEAGEPMDGEAEGFTARVIQHEIDHLKGTLIVDRLTEGTIHGHPKDMALMRIKDMNKDEKQLMKKMIEETIAKGEEAERYQELLAVLNNELA